ncbi:MAG TPA: helix-turn-helix transcriptional regulator [Pseudonocardiaceae bacterium]|nr:helix-turn-helix transcriptional regulator [Pseudonocardiaceae bacterium]
MQELIPDSVLVDCSAAALYAGRRDSCDHDHVLTDLADRFEVVLDAVESQDGGVTDRVAPGKIISGELGGIETGIRQALTDRMGIDRAVMTLSSIDEYYADQHGAGDGVASQLVRQLAEPAPKDCSTTRNLRQDKSLSALAGVGRDRRGLPPAGDHDGGKPAMSLVFRNIDVSPEDPVEVWTTEAILTALERGGLEHWRRIAAAINEDPWGPVARRVEEALRVSQLYGVGVVMADVLAAARRRAERAAVAAEITRLQAASGITRAEFASAIGTSVSRLSTYLSGKVTPSAALLVRMRRVATRGSSPPPFGAESRF